MIPGISLNSLKTLQAKFLVCVLPPVIVSFLLFSILQTVFTYQERQAYILANLEDQASSLASLLANSLWNMDFQMTAVQIDTLLLLPNITGVKVVELTTGKVMEKGLIPEKNKTPVFFRVDSPILFSALDGKKHIGDLTVFADKPKLNAPLFHTLVRDTLLLLLLLLVIVASAVTAHRYIIGKPLALFLTAIRRADKERDRQQVEWFVQDELGSVINAYNNLLINVTDVEQELKESEEKFRDVVERANDGIVIVQDKGITYANPRAAEIVGYTVEELQNLPLTTFLRKKDLTDLWKKYQHRLAGKEMAEVYETTFVHRDGQAINVEVNASLHRVRGVLADIVIIRDITLRKKEEEEKKELENKLQQAKKMEAIGLMAGGVAHDLNNILSGIVSYPELILHQLPADSELKRPIEAIYDSGIRAARVVDDLLTVARGIASERDISNVNILILDYLKSPEGLKLQSLHTSVEIIIDLDVALNNVSCSRVHISKCIMNLVTNALEAVEGKGQIFIYTRNQYVEELKSYEHHLQPGEYIVMGFADSGVGISKEDQDHIFEPFYTKKNMGRSGTGLGLSVVWNSVKDHGGAITVTSNEKGSKFDLYLPATLQSLSTESDGFQQKDFHQGMGQHILVVDDDSLQREVAGELLVTLGYKITRVGSGEEALDIIKSQPMDLVLLDMLMDPGMNGRQTYEEMVKVRPGQKALIVSGYSETDEVRLAQEAGVLNFIKKPYTLHQIGNAVQQALLFSGVDDTP